MNLFKAISCLILCYFSLFAAFWLEIAVKRTISVEIVEKQFFSRDCEKSVISKEKIVFSLQKLPFVNKPAYLSLIAAFGLEITISLEIVEKVLVLVKLKKT